MTQTEKFSKDIEGKLFKNRRGNFVHIKLIDQHVYARKERKFDMCEASTKEEAIATQTGCWSFTNSIKSMIRKGTLVCVN